MYKTVLMIISFLFISLQGSDQSDFTIATDYINRITPAVEEAITELRNNPEYDDTVIELLANILYFSHQRLYYANCIETHFHKTIMILWSWKQEREHFKSPIESAEFIQKYISLLESSCTEYEYIVETHNNLMAYLENSKYSPITPIIQMLANHEAELMNLCIEEQKTKTDASYDFYKQESHRFANTFGIMSKAFASAIDGTYPFSEQFKNNAELAKINLMQRFIHPFEQLSERSLNVVIDIDQQLEYFYQSGLLVIFTYYKTVYKFLNEQSVKNLPTPDMLTLPLNINLQ